MGVIMLSIVWDERVSWVGYGSLRLRFKISRFLLPWKDMVPIKPVGGFLSEVEAESDGGKEEQLPETMWRRFLGDHGEGHSAGRSKSHCS